MQTICELNGPWDEENYAANARLIAAAPELLEALESTANCLERMLTKHDEQVRPWTDSLTKARNAIAKARGEN